MLKKTLSALTPIDALKKASLFEGFLLFLALIVTLVSSFPIIEPYRLFQGYIPIEKCTTTGGHLLKMEKRNGYVTISYKKNSKVESNSISGGLGTWNIDPRKPISGNVLIHQCPYLHWLPLTGQVTVNNKIVYQYDNKEDFDWTSRLYKNFIFIYMPISLTIYLIILHYLRRK